MVALEEAVRLDMSRLQDALREVAPPMPLRNVNESESTATFEVDGRTAAITVVPMPIPWSDVEAPCRAAWWSWPEAVFRNHRVHVVMFVSGSGNTVQAHRVLTALIVAAIRVLPSVDVYCGSARIVQFFVSQASGLDEDGPPIMLWVGFHPHKGDRTVGAFTTGLPVFGHWDLLEAFARRGP